MRIEQLTFTRFLAAVSIFIFHYGTSVYPFNVGFMAFLVSQANVGVSYFYMLSGFVMIIAYGDKGKISFSDYLKKRLVRIYPVFILATLILLGCCFFLGIKLDLEDVLLNVTMTQSWVPGKALSFNVPGWSICVEMFFYILFPIFFNKFYSKMNYKRLLFPIVLIFVLSQGFLHIMLKYPGFYGGYPSKTHDLLFYFPLMHLNEFLIGNLAGLFFLNGFKKSNYDWLIVLLILLPVFLIKYNPGITYHNGMLAFVFVPLIMLISANKGWITKISTYKPLVFLGEISYGMYILQFPVYAWTSTAFAYMGNEDPALIFCFSFVALVLLSAFSYQYIESPLRNKLKRVGVRSMMLAAIKLRS